MSKETMGLIIIGALALAAFINVCMFFWFPPWEAIVGTLGFTFAYGAYMGFKRPECLMSWWSNLPNILVGTMVALMFYPGWGVAFYLTTLCISTFIAIGMMQPAKA